MTTPHDAACPHCAAGEPSVWDHVLEHFAHPAVGGKLKFCHAPWHERCRRCSAEVTVTGGGCGACRPLAELEGAP